MARVIAKRCNFPVQMRILFKHSRKAFYVTQIELKISKLNKYFANSSIDWVLSCSLLPPSHTHSDGIRSGRETNCECNQFVKYVKRSKPILNENPFYPGTINAFHVISGEYRNVLLHALGERMPQLMYINWKIWMQCCLAD